MTMFNNIILHAVESTILLHLINRIVVYAIAPLVYNQPPAITGKGSKWCSVIKLKRLFKWGFSSRRAENLIYL